MTVATRVYGNTKTAPAPLEPPSPEENEQPVLTPSPRIGAAATAAGLAPQKFEMEPEPEPAPEVDASLESAPGIDGSLEPAPAAPEGDAEEEEMAPEEIYAQLRALCASINSKLGDTQAELHEHKMVKTALEPLEDDRRCFRLMGSVLVEKTKGEVLPQILEQMSKVRPRAVLASRDNARRSPLPWPPAPASRAITAANASPRDCPSRSWRSWPSRTALSSRTPRRGSASTWRRTRSATRRPRRPTRLTRRSSGEAKAVCWCESCCHGRSVTNAFLVHHPPVSNRPPAASCEPSSLPRHHSVVFCAVAEARPKPPAPSPPVAVSQRSLSHDRPISAPVPETISSSASISVPPASPRDTEREGRNPHHTHRGQHRIERLMPSVLLLSFSPSLCCRAAVQQAGRQAGRQAGKRFECVVACVRTVVAGRADWNTRLHDRTRRVHHCTRRRRSTRQDLLCLVASSLPFAQKIRAEQIGHSLERDKRRAFGG